MKVYVVTAWWHGETYVCGVALDYATAEKIKEHEENKDFLFDSVEINEYDTDHHSPLNEGLKPFVVTVRQTGAEVESTSLAAFVPNRVRSYDSCSMIDVYAKDETQAVKLAFDLYNKNLQVD